MSLIAQSYPNLSRRHQNKVYCRHQNHLVKIVVMKSFTNYVDKISLVSKQYEMRYYHL